MGGCGGSSGGSIATKRNARSNCALITRCTQDWQIAPSSFEDQHLAWLFASYHASSNNFSTINESMEHVQGCCLIHVNRWTISCHTTTSTCLCQHEYAYLLRIAKPFKDSNIRQVLDIMLIQLGLRINHRMNETYFDMTSEYLT